MRSLRIPGTAQNVGKAECGLPRICRLGQTRACVRMYGVCMVYVRCMYGVCMVYVRCMCTYVRCMCTYVWCMYGVCTVLSAGNVPDLTYVW